MKVTYIITPGIAAAVRVQKLPDGEWQSVIFLGQERGCVVGSRNKTMQEAGFPTELQAEINNHFLHVFSLAHEGWRAPHNLPGAKSPRADYCDSLMAWYVECEDTNENPCREIT